MSDLNRLSEKARAIAEEATALERETQMLQEQMSHGAMIDPFIFGITVFVLACFVGYYVVWKVTPALHTPLMAITNAISSIIILGALMQIGSGSFLVILLAALSVFMAGINIFGGFLVTRRMLAMFQKS